MFSLDNLTLQRRIALIVLSGMVIGLSLFSWLGVQSLHESTDRILDERLTIARHMASHLDETLSYILVNLQDINFNGSLPTREQFGSAAGSLRKTLAQSGIATRNVILADRTGKILQVEPANPRIIGLNMTKYPEVAPVLETGLATVSSLVSGPTTETPSEPEAAPFLNEVPTVFASVPLFDVANNIIGMMTISIDIEQSTNYAIRPAITVGETGYTEIVDGNGIVLARTSPGSPPELFEMSDHPGRFAELISQRKATTGTCHRCHETESAVMRRQDVLAFAPISATSWGIVIRQSEEEALAPTRQLERRLLYAGTIILVVTILSIWIMMQGIVRPIRTLTAAARKVASGDFKAAMPTRRKDEIGQLSTAFYNMTQELAESRNELVIRNEDLSALNTIAVTLSQSLNLKTVLENTMLKILEVTRTTAGCVFLRDADSNRLVMMNRIGAASVFNCQAAGSPLANCACHQVLREGQTLIVNDVSQCPMLADGSEAKGDIDSFASVPLKSKDRTVGIMNISCGPERSFTENDFQILDSIGHHVGLTIENSVLYEDTKQKEKLRGQLLSSVIDAQEDERKRIARELHDEYGQLLTGLLMNIESLENVTARQPAQFNNKLQNMKALIIRALEDMRRLTLNLRPSTLDDLGLVATVRAYAQSHLEDAGIAVNFEYNGLGKRLEPTLETTLFRIIQEAIHNITRHAEARNVKIQLKADNNKITVIVEDDGQGFDVATVLRSRVGKQALGLLGIQERAALLGGTTEIESRKGQGTRLTVEIPLPGRQG